MKTITKRGVVWLGQTCNLKCYFCYFREKIDNKSHPEHDFMSLEKAKKIMHTLRNIYGNRYVDIQGGEPTIYPHIYELIEYCNQIGIKPTLITNGIVLADEEKVKKFKEAGIEDFLFSIHALGDDYDKIVGVKGAHNKQMQALNNLKKYNIPVRFNLTMTKESIPHILNIAKLAIEYDIKVMNLIAFNPFADQQGNRDTRNVPKYSELKEIIQTVIDILEEKGIEVNVRYFPICILDEKYRKNIYNFQQLPYDKWEWDYNSWTWTARFNQRSNSDKLDRPVPILMYNIDEYNGIDFSKYSKYGTKEHFHHNDLPLENIYEFMLKLFSADVPKELLYKNNAKLRAEKHTGYKKCETCKNCDIEDICDGFHGDYAEVFGMDEAKAIEIGEKITDPKFYINNQQKITYEE